MSKINIYIIERNIVGCATSDEESVLQSWLERNKANRDAYFRMKNIWDSCQIKGYSQDAIRREWELLAKRIHTIEIQPKHAISKASFVRPWMRYAAVFAMAVALTYVVVLLVQSPKPDSQTVAQQTIYQQITVPNGQRTQVVLADGSKVWLNAGTTLKYPLDFNINNRQVILDGEASFQIIPSDIPFTVTADAVEISVLGTHFNVRNYSTDDYVETALFEGSVRVFSQQKELMMHAGEVATYRKNQQIMAVKQFPNIAQKMAWNNHHLIIDAERLEDIARTLERWYNVQITITNDELKNDRYTGKFVYNEDIKQVLKAIGATTSIKYKIEGNEIIISKSLKKEGE